MNRLNCTSIFLLAIFLILYGSFKVLASDSQPAETNELILDSCIFTASMNDSLNLLEIINPQNLSSHFSRPQNFTYQFGYNTDWHWMAFKIHNKSHSPKEYYLIVQNAMIEYLDFYQVDEISNKIIYHDQTGFGLPFSSRDIQEKQFAFKISLPHSSSSFIYLRANLSAGNLMLPLRLFNSNGFLKHQSFHSSITTLTNTVWIMASIAALLLWFVLKEQIYLYYFGYVFCLMMYWSSYEGISFELLWPNNPYLADISRDFYAPAAVSFAAFAMSILTTAGRKLNILRKLIRWISWSFLPVTLLVCIPTEFMPIRNQLVGMMDILLIGLILVILYAISIKIVEKNEYTQLLILAMSPMLAFTVVQVLTFRGILPISRNNPFIQYGFGICAIIEIMFMFVLLAYRFRKILFFYHVTQQRLSQTNNLLTDYQEAIKIRKSTPYSNSKYSEEQLKSLLAEVENILTEKKSYKDPELNLQKLADLVKCSPHLLSQCINQLTGTNFNDYINSYRIKESEFMLLSPEFDHISIEGIGSEVGFASKTSFYSTFKKTYGMTPKEYKLKKSKN